MGRFASIMRSNRSWAISPQICYIDVPGLMSNCSRVISHPSTSCPRGLYFFTSIWNEMDSLQCWPTQSPGHSSSFTPICMWGGFPIFFASIFSLKFFECPDYEFVEFNKLNKPLPSAHCRPPRAAVGPPCPGCQHHVWEAYGYHMEAVILGPLILNMLQIHFSLQNIWFKCCPIYFNPKFLVWILNVKISNLCTSFWILVYFRLFSNFNPSTIPHVLQ